MDAFAAANHLLNFVAPALFVALLLASTTFVQRNSDMGRLARFWRTFWCLSLVGAATLTVCLIAFGRDGQIASYAALVFALATTRWLLARGWRD